MRQVTAPAILLLAAIPSFATAQDGVVTDPVIVTATRTAETASETLASVTVVTRADLERRQARSVPDALRGIPGLAISNTGGPGKATSFFLRGTESDHVLVLIDGIEVGSATLGTTPFQNLPIAEVERIEVVRGPRSSLYGSEAIGGVIQIFTRRGGGDLTPRFSVGAGSYNSASVSGGLSGGGEQAWFDLSGSFEDTDGFDACRGRSFPFAGCGVEEPDDDGYQRHALAARGGYRFGDLAKIDVHWLRTESETEYDGSIFAGNESKDLQQVLGARLALTPLAQWTTSLSGGRSWDESRVFFDGLSVNEIETRRDNLSWQNDIGIGTDHLAVLGLDYQQDSISSDLAYAEDSRDNTGVFGQYLGTIGANDVELSLRHDDNEQYGGQTTGSAAWGYRFGNGTRLTASYGTAFRAPTFNELYYPGFGNPDLEPEESASVEVGLSGTTALLDWRLNLYQTDIDELIAYDPVLWAPANIDSARIRGLEAVGTAQVFDWDVDANLTWLDPENRSSGPNKGNLLPRRPEQTFRLDLDRTYGRFGLGGTVFVAGRRFDDPANRVRLDAYTLVDLRVEYALSRALRLQGRLENLFDEDYETAAWYNQGERAVYLTLRYQP